MIGRAYVDEVVGDVAAAAEAHRLAPGLDVAEGDAGVEALAGESAADTVLCALVGLAGLRPVLAAMASGKDVALATKEVLVAAGEPVMRARDDRVLADRIDQPFEDFGLEGLSGFGTGFQRRDVVDDRLLRHIAIQIS